MIVIPAIDLKNGQCVRLLQGEAHQETVYSDNPVATAKMFEEAGAQRLHLVDLDGAFQGKTANLQSIQAIVQALGIPAELGGGIRTQKDIESMLALGIDSVIVGTMAVKNPQILQSALQSSFGERIILGIDSRQGKVAVEGWAEQTEIDDVDFGKYWKQQGIERIIFTDISRDGMLAGPNLPALRHFALGTQMKITASGGVASRTDIEELRGLEPLGVDHVIVGKAIYEGTLSLQEALSC